MHESAVYFIKFAPPKSGNSHHFPTRKFSVSLEMGSPGINLGKIHRIFLYPGVSPRKFIVPTELCLNS
jgi:hypothetical protein